MIDIDKLKLRDWVQTPRGVGVVQGFVVTGSARDKVIVSLGTFERHHKKLPSLRTGRMHGVWNLVMFTPDVLEPARD